MRKYVGASQLTLDQNHDGFWFITDEQTRIAGPFSDRETANLARAAVQVDIRNVRQTWFLHLDLETMEYFVSRGKEAGMSVHYIAPVGEICREIRRLQWTSS